MRWRLYVSKRFEILWHPILFKITFTFHKILANSKSFCHLISSLSISTKYLVNIFRDHNSWDGDTICKCGLNDSNMTQFGYDDRKWCCKTTSEKCTTRTRYHHRGPVEVKCIGIPLNLTQQCHHNDNDSTRCNYYPMDSYRVSIAARSYVDICQDNK